MDGGSGVYAELTCTAMSEDDGVRYEKTDTKVVVRPEDALALLLCYAAQVNEIISLMNCSVFAAQVRAAPPLAPNEKPLVLGAR